MRICQLSTVESVYNFLAPTVRVLREDGHEVVAACNLESDGREVRRHLGPDVAAHRIVAARRVTARTVTVDVLALARYLREQRFDVVHVHGPLVAIQARLAARLAGVPVVVSQAHGFYFHAGTAAPLRLALRWMEQVLCRHLTDYVVTVSREDHELAVRHRFRPHADQVVHVPGVGVDTDRFRPADGLDPDTADRRRIRREVGDTPTDRVVTFVGRLVGEKGLVELAEAFVLLAGDDPGLRLWLVGDVLASERDRTAPDRVRTLLAQHGLQDHVRFLGRREDVAAVLRASDVFVLPSHREGMPVSLLEAMATGLPVVTTDIRGCREAVGPEVSGLLVPPRDGPRLAEALRRVVTDPQLRQRLGAAAREQVLEHHSVRASTAPMRALYDRIAADLGEHPVRGPVAQHAAS